MVWRQDYYPFGDSLSGGDLGDDEQGFTNQLADQDAGLYYFRARWYDPELGRFYPLDPAGQGTNSYAYAGDNP